MSGLAPLHPEFSLSNKNDIPSFKRRLFTLALLITSVVIAGGLIALGAMGLFATQSSLPSWLAHAVGTIGHSGSIAMLVFGCYYIGIGTIALLVKAIQSKNKAT